MGKEIPRTNSELFNVLAQVYLASELSKTCLTLGLLIEKLRHCRSIVRRVKDGQNAGVMGNGGSFVFTMGWLIGEDNASG